MTQGVGRVIKVDGVSYCSIHTKQERRRRSNGNTYCHLCWRELQRLYRADHKINGLCLSCSKPVVIGGVYCAYHLQRRRLRTDVRREKGICSNCTKPAIPNCRYCEWHALEERDYHRKRVMVLKQDAVNVLGGCCNVCGISEIDVLQFDHINGDGYKEGRHRMIGGTLYKWIIDNPNIAVGKYQALCANCHVRKTTMEVYKPGCGKRLKQANGVEVGAYA